MILAMRVSAVAGVVKSSAATGMKPALPQSSTSSQCRMPKPEVPQPQAKPAPHGLSCGAFRIGKFPPFPPRP